MTPTVPELTAVITFHREAIFAHAALSSYLLSRARAARAGLDVAMVIVLDNASAETSRVVRGHPGLMGDELILDASVGDSALARNLGIAHASSEYVCTLDGDDLISRDYFERHVQMARATPGRVILHAEIVVSFGRDDFFSWQMDQRTMPFSRDMLISENPWVSAAFAHRKVFLEVPYVACYPQATGFGYEDWHWNCQTTADGFEHIAVPGTAYFYRLKEAGSVNAVNSALRVVMPPSRLFDAWEAP